MLITQMEYSVKKCQGKGQKYTHNEFRLHFLIEMEQIVILATKYMDLELYFEP